ncbi:MAG: gamma-aminobutyrate dehydratase [Clostridia bacterium]|nr:gamma-aminobutyrate dehydratase [Clostridia bacterium]
MGLRTFEEYLESLRDGRRVMFRGQWVEDVTRHPVIGRAVRHAQLDFDLAEDPAWRDRAVADPARPAPAGASPAEGEEPYNRFYHVPRNAADLLLRMELIEEITRRGGTVVTLIHEIGTDALFGLMRVTGRVDAARGTGYRQRVERFYEQVRREDAALAVAQTDVKGNRRARPSAQADPDLFVRVVRREADGIVVRGAKVHTSVSVNANYLIVIPTQRMEEADRDYAVAFAVPVAAPGVRLVASPYLSSPRNTLENPLSGRFKMMESFTWFDDVFVPWENVFLCGEHEFAGEVARAFVDYHRFTAVAYKLPLVDLLAGVGAQMAEYNGVSGAGHVREKLIRLAAYAGTVRKMLVASALLGQAREEGIFVPDELTINLAKLYFAENFHAALRDVQDLSGGLLVTAPGAEDLADPEMGPVLRRFYQGATGTGEERLRMAYLASDLTAGDMAGYHGVLAVHAEGSIEAEKIAILRGYDFARAQRMAREAAGVEPAGAAAGAAGEG